MSAKKNILTSIIISLVIGVLLGVLLIVLSSIINVSFLVKWSLIIIGIFTIIGNVPSLITGILNVNKARGLVDLIFSALGILLGLMMIFKQGTIISIAVSAYLIIFPIIRIVLSGKQGWKDQIKREWIKILIGALLLAFLPAIQAGADAIVSLIILIAGWAVVGLSVVFFVISLISYFKAIRSVENAAPIEVSAEEKTEE